MLERWSPLVESIRFSPHRYVAVAESCTGGLVGAAITAQPGVSGWFKGSIVCYHNDLKMSLLDVPLSVLERQGAVSKACALRMSHGVRQRLDAQIGLAVTGIAGPTGGTPTKPAGLVYIAISDESGQRCDEYRFTGDRSEVRIQTVEEALLALQRWR